jgi:hypothetical protein
MIQFTHTGPKGNPEACSEVIQKKKLSKKKRKKRGDVGGARGMGRKRRANGWYSDQSMTWYGLFPHEGLDGLSTGEGDAHRSGDISFGTDADVRCNAWATTVYGYARDRNEHKFLSARTFGRWPAFFGRLRTE